jgi:hypothetical protein
MYIRKESACMAGPMTKDKLNGLYGMNHIMFRQTKRENLTNELLKIGRGKEAFKRGGGGFGKGEERKKRLYPVHEA